MKNKIIIFLVLASFSGFGQITRTLPNVTNTADSMKPVSVAQKAAIVQKLHTAASISALQAFTDANTAQFDGSTWNKISGNVASNGGAFAGTIVNVSTSFYWQRKFDSYINVKWFGATGLGVVDETVAITNAIAFAGTNISGNSGGNLFIPKGTYKANFVIPSGSKININGESESGTILSPFDITKPAITINSDGSWIRMTISQITFQGVGLTGIGIQFGNIPYVVNDEYAGRTNIEHCRFINFDKCISRTAGNIGLYLNICTFGSANYHLWGQGVTNMQVGVTQVLNCHFDSANLASICIKSGFLGDGQFIFTNDVFEGNTGFVLFIDTYSETAFVPEITFENCWNEVNATATSVTIGGIVYTPQFAYLKNVSNISFINSPVSTLTLINSNCFLDRTDISQIVVKKDNQSLLQIENAILESVQTHEFVRNIKSSLRPAGGYSSYFTSYHRNTLNDLNLPNVKISVPFNKTYQFTGTGLRNTVSVPNDGTTYNNCESLLINQGDIFLTNTNATITASKYYVYTLSYKLVSGLAPTFQLTENTTLSPLISLNSNKWETLCGIVSTFGVTGLPLTTRVYLKPATLGSSTINLGGFQLLEFDNQQDAMNFLESKTFTGSKDLLNTFSLISQPNIFTGANSFTQNVGIGNTNPTSRLQISATSGTTSLAVNGNGATMYIDFGGSGNNYIDGGSNIFRTFSGVEKMRLETSTGNLGIGTGNPTSKLQVVGIQAFADNASAIAGGLTSGAFYRTATGVLMIVF